MAAPRVRLEVWKPSITVVDSDGVEQVATQDPELWIRCDTFENVATNQLRGNAVQAVDIEDDMFRPRSAMITLTNKPQDFRAYDDETYDYQHKDSDNNAMAISGSGATTKLRKNWGPLRHFFYEFQNVRIIDEETHSVLFTGHIYKITHSFENSSGASVRLECRDALEMLKNISLKDLVHKAKFTASNRRSDIINYLLNLSVDYYANKPAAKDTQGDDAVDDSPEIGALQGATSFLNNKDWSASDAQNSYNRFERSGTTLGKELIYDVSGSGSRNVLTEILRWATSEPHANETVEDDFGYDFFVDPNMGGVGVWTNLSASVGPKPAMLNYFSRGNRLSSTGSASQEAKEFGVTAVYPVINSWPRHGATQVKLGELGTAIANASQTGVFIKAGNTCHVGQVIQIESEKLLIQEAGASSSQQDYFKVRRGVDGTTAAGHSIDLDVVEIRGAVFTMQPSFHFSEDKDQLHTEALLTFDSETNDTIASSSKDGVGSKNTRQRTKRFEIAYVSELSGQFSYIGKTWDQFYSRGGIDDGLAAEYVSAYREDGSTLIAANVARVQYQSDASITGAGNFAYIILSDITSAFPTANVSVSGSDQNFVVLKGINSAVTCRLNCNATRAQQGRPSVVWGGGNTSASTGHAYRKTIEITRSNDKNVDDLRREIANRLALASWPTMEGSFTTSKAPYYWFDGLVQAVTSDSPGQTVKVKHKNGSAAINLTNYGIREGMLVHKRTADFSSIAQANNKDVYGYIETMHFDDHISVALTQSQTFSVGDPIRIIIPIRAGDTMFVDNPLAHVYGEHLITETRFFSGSGLQTSYTTSGENEERIRKQGGSRAKRTVWNSIARDNLVKSESIPVKEMPLANEAFTCSFDFGYTAGGLITWGNQSSWGTAGQITLANGKIYNIEAGNTQYADGNTQAYSSTTGGSSGKVYSIHTGALASGTKYVIYLDPEGENPSSNAYVLQTRTAATYVQDKDNVIIMSVTGKGSALPSAKKGPNFTTLGDDDAKSWADSLLQEASVSNTLIVANTIAADKFAATLAFVSELRLDTNGKIVTSSSGINLSGSNDTNWALSRAGILLDPSGIYGASGDDHDDLQFYIKATDGRAYFGNGSVVIDKQGIKFGDGATVDLDGDAQGAAYISWRTSVASATYGTASADSPHGKVDTLLYHEQTGDANQLWWFGDSGQRRVTSASANLDLDAMVFFNMSLGTSTYKIPEIHVGLVGNLNTYTPVIFKDQGSTPGNCPVDAALWLYSEAEVLKYKDGDGNVVILDGSGGQHSFKYIAVSGQDTVTADSTTDTLTFVASTGISLTTDNSADSIAIHATGTYIEGVRVLSGDGIELSSNGSSFSEPTQVLSGDVWLRIDEANDFSWTGKHTFSHNGSDNAILIPVGTAAKPSIAFVADDNSGIWSSGNNEVCISALGVTRLKVDSSAADAGFLYIEKSQVNIETAFIPDSSGQSHELYEGGGTIQRNTSTRRGKTNIVDIEVDTSKIYNLQAKTFNRRKPLGEIDEASGVRKYSDEYNPAKEIGFISEEVYPEVPSVVTLDDEGNPLGIQYSMISVLLVEEVKKLKDRIEALEGN